MTAAATIRMLQAGARTANAAERQRKAARVAWVKEAMAGLRIAQRHVTEAWDRIFAKLPDDISDEEVEALPEPPEQAELDAIHALIDDVIERDKWPRELYFGEI